MKIDITGGVAILATLIALDRTMGTGTRLVLLVIIAIGWWVLVGGNTRYR